MPTISKTRYYKVVGHQEQPDGDVVHYLRQVTDFTGATFEMMAGYETHVTSAATEQPRGTIVKIADTREITLNPTS